MPVYGLESYRRLRLEAPSYSVKEEVVVPVEPQSPPTPEEDVASLLEQGSGKMVDVSYNLGGSTVEFLETDLGIDRLSFTLRHGAEGWLDHLRVGYRAIFEGGYAQEISGVQTRRTFIDGVVSRMSPVFPDSGVPELQVTVESLLFLLTRNRPGKVSFPNAGDSPEDLLHRRVFHLGRSTIRMSEIIKGVVEEYGIEVAQIRIDPEHDSEFDATHVVTQQEDETDFDFLLRLVTGRSRNSAPGRRAIGTAQDEAENPTINGHARMFMEFHPLSGKPVFRVVPEKELLSDRGALKFLYQSAQSRRHRIIPSSQYDPLSPTAELIIKNVSLSDDPDTARGKETQVVSDVSTDPQVGDEGAQQKEVSVFGDKLFIGTVIEPILKEAIAKKEIASAELLDPVAGRFGKRAIGAYYTQPQTKFQPAGTKLSNDPDKNKKKPGAAPASAPTQVLGSGSGGDGAPGTADSVSRDKGDKYRRFGQSLSFETHGNIFMLKARAYQVELGVGRYDGFWYATKVTHVFGKTYRMKVEMGA